MTSSKAQSPIEISRSASGEKRLTELGIALPPHLSPSGFMSTRFREEICSVYRQLFSGSVIKQCLKTEWRYLCFETCDHCRLLGLVF